MKLLSRPATRGLSGTIRPPGDKSISHRAAILGGLADGRTRIDGFLLADDTLATLQAMQSLGADIQRSDDQVEIIGQTLQAPRMDINLGNSGTGLRLLTGAICGHPDLFGQRLRLVGDESLSGRPMGRIIEPLQRMGASITSNEQRAPLLVEPKPLTGCTHALKIASAQVKSAILLAGLQSQGITRVNEPGISRDHTERMLPDFGIRVQHHSDAVELTGPQQLQHGVVHVPADLSSAAFLLAAALLVPGSDIRLQAVGMNPSRDGFLRIVKGMIADDRLQLQPTAESDGREPMADLQARYADRRTGTTIAPELVPLAIDEFPLLMAMAATASGQTVISGAAELRVKESDRLAVMCRQLQTLGVELEERPDGAVVTGGPIRGGAVDAAGDHRIAMSLAVLGQVAQAPVEIDRAEWIRTSYPQFVEHMNQLGANMAWVD